MKNYTKLISLVILLSCSQKGNEKQPTAIVEDIVKETPSHQEKYIEMDKPIILTPIFSSGNLDSLAKINAKKLEKKYSSTPFYTFINGRIYYIISNREYHYSVNRFNKTIKYGLVNDSLKTLIEPQFSKISNHDLVIKNCIEIEKNNKIGLYNYTQELSILPQFDFILPTQIISNIGYGLKDNEWFKIDSKSMEIELDPSFDPIPIIELLSFDLQDTWDKMIYRTDFVISSDDAETGAGVVVMPSYSNFIKPFKKTWFDDYLLPETGGEFGTQAAQFRTKKTLSVSDKIVSFLISAYEKGVNGRGYSTESKKLLLYNKESQESTISELYELSDYGNFCSEGGWRFVNDSILEIKTNPYFSTNYSYKKISKDGYVTELKSNRQYDFTKFIIITEDHFRGCFARKSNGEFGEGDYNMIRYDHLTIDDLDIMRNEIFADYGYQFKTERWNKYFGQKSWYSPKFEDVNDKLTEIEKMNIKTILQVKEKMKGRENTFTQERPVSYHAAG